MDEISSELIEVSSGNLNPNFLEFDDLDRAIDEELVN